jgi:hypothetical protein
MKFHWDITPEDVERVRAFVARREGDPFVIDRKRHNLAEQKPSVREAGVWKTLVGCLLTTQQRSGPESAVTRLLCTTPFPLAYESCVRVTSVGQFVTRALAEFGGIRRFKLIGQELEKNLAALQGGLWPARAPERPPPVDCHSEAGERCRGVPRRTPGWAWPQAEPEPAPDPWPHEIRDPHRQPSDEKAQRTRVSPATRGRSAVRSWLLRLRFWRHPRPMRSSGHLPLHPRRRLLRQLRLRFLDNREHPGLARRALTHRFPRADSRSAKRSASRRQNDLTASK